MKILIVLLTVFYLQACGNEDSNTSSTATGNQAGDDVTNSDTTDGENKDKPADSNQTGDVTDKPDATTDTPAGENKQDEKETPKEEVKEGKLAYKEE